MNAPWLKHVLEENQRNAKIHADMNNVGLMLNVRSRIIELDVFVLHNIQAIHTADVGPMSAYKTLTVQLHWLVEMKSVLTLAIVQKMRIVVLEIIVVFVPAEKDTLAIHMVTNAP